MKIQFKRILATVMVAAMLLTGAPLGGFAGLDLSGLLGFEAEAATATDYEVGDIVEFGSYPQSKVEDSATLNALNAKTLSWKSYGYYSGNGSYGSMTAKDYMRYADVSYNGDKYRAVKFSHYRPYYTYSSSYTNTYQDDNGYSPNTVYWFKYEPLEWRVLDPTTGYIMCETIIDSQPYSNTIYEGGKDANGYTGYWNDAAKTNYANDWATSSLREWLNDDFYNTAFTRSEQSQIKQTTLDNSPAYESNKNTYADTTDYIFIPSYSDMLNTSYGFNSSYSNYDTARQAQGSDYARCQGLYTVSSGTYEGNSYWRLRSPCYFSFSTSFVYYDGYVYDSNDNVSGSNFGIRPALRISNLQSEICVHATSRLVRVEPTCTDDGLEYTVCDDCGEFLSETTTLPAAHKWGEWVRTKAPEIGINGMDERTCSACGEKETRVVPMLGESVEDENTGIVIVYPEEAFEGDMVVEVKEKFDGSSFIISGSSNQKTFDITTLVDGESVQPSAPVIVRIPLPEGFDTAKTFVYHLNTETGEREKIDCRHEGGYIIFEASHFSIYCVAQMENIELESIEVEKAPNVLNYTYKSATSTEGLKVVAHYSDGTDPDITDKVEVKNFDTNKPAGTKTATVEFEGKTATFEYTVKYTWWQWIIRILLLGFLWY